MENLSIGGRSNWSLPHNIASVPTSLRCSDWGVMICLRFDLNIVNLLSNISKIDGNLILLEEVRNKNSLVENSSGTVLFRGNFDE
jgi:hypothetical protein